MLVAPEDGNPPGPRPARRPNLAEAVYLQIKDDIFEFRLLPGDRFTEGQVAERLSVSRTPVREALQRLEKEGYLEVHFRSSTISTTSGSSWSVRPCGICASRTSGRRWSP